jgi:hypothetical protein
MNEIERSLPYSDLYSAADALSSIRHVDGDDWPEYCAKAMNIASALGVAAEKYGDELKGLAQRSGFLMRMGLKAGITNLTMTAANMERWSGTFLQIGMNATHPSAKGQFLVKFAEFRKYADSTIDYIVSAKNRQPL